MVDFNLEALQDEVIFSSIVFSLWGAMLFLPSSMFFKLPATGFLSGLFSNVVGYMTDALIGASTSPYVLGVVFVLLGASLLVYGDAAVSFAFLTSSSMAVYTFFTLLHLYFVPLDVTGIQSIGLLLQFMVFGSSAALLYFRRIRIEKFSLRYDRNIYITSFILLFLSMGSLSLAHYVFTLDSAFWTSLSIFGLFFGFSLAATVKWLLNDSRIGLDAAMISLTILTAVSLFLVGSRLFATLFIALELMVWNRKRYFGQISMPVDEIKRNLEF